MVRAIAVVVGALATWSVAAAQQPAAEQHVRGDVVSVNGNTVEVKTRAGATTKFTLGDQTRVSVATKGDLSQIDQNAFIGTTAVQQPDGTLRALEVHVFPEAMRGAGEGHRPWDLQAGSSMTNATVAGMEKGGPPSTMTNATVADAAKGGGGLRLKLRYAGGEKTVVVPAGTTVVKLQPSDRSQLTPGAHVFAAVKGGGKAPVADRITVGKDVVPPM